MPEYVIKSLFSTNQPLPEGSLTSRGLVSQGLGVIFMRVTSKDLIFSGVVASTALVTLIIRA